MKKFWIWSGSILGVFAIIVILSLTVFTLKSASIEFHNETTIFASEEMQTDIIESASLPYNSCVFFMDKQSIINQLEKSYPYLKIINIETNFPNSITFHAKQREAVFALKFEGGYYEVDKDFKVLEVKTTTFESTQSNFIDIKTKNTTPINLTSGDFLDIPEIEVLKNISPAFELTNRDIISQMALIKDIEIITTSNVEKPTDTENFGLLMHDFNGLEIVITNAKTFLPQKINTFCYIQAMFVEKSATHYCLVYHTTSGTIEAQAVEKTTE